MHAWKLVLPAAVMALAVFSPTSTSAGFLSGIDLLETCQPQPADPVYRLKLAECHGYVVGIADTFDCALTAQGFTWNSSTASSQHDMVETVVKWLKSHQGELGYQANGLVAAALSDAFPCGEASATRPAVAADIQ